MPLVPPVPTSMRQFERYCQVQAHRGEICAEQHQNTLKVMIVPNILEAFTGFLSSLMNTILYRTELF